jgi:hypothetical protein
MKLVLDKWLIFLGCGCSRLLFSRLFGFSADISKAAMRFRLLFTTIYNLGALEWGALLDRDLLPA